MARVKKLRSLNCRVRFFQVLVEDNLNETMDRSFARSMLCNTDLN